MKQKHAMTAEQKNIFISLIKIIGIPILIISTALIALTVFNYTTSRKLLEENTSELLSRIAKASDSKITTLADTTAMLKGNDTLYSALYDSESDFTEETSRELSMIKNTYPYLDNIAIINQASDMICDTDGSYSMEYYLNNKYTYQNYNTSYWRSFRFYNTTDYRILSPTNVSTNNENKIIIPIIFRRTDDFLMKNMLVYNIDLRHFIDYSKESGNEIHLDVYLLNRYTNEIFLSDGTALTSDYFPQEFYDILLENPNGAFDCELSDGHMMVVTYSTKNTLTGYSYFSLIDKNIIRRQLIPNIFISFAIIIIFLIVAVVLALKSTKNVSVPLGEIANVLSDSSSGKSTGNVFRDMVTQTQGLATEKNNLIKTLPCAQEKFLIDYLNATEYCIDENTRNIIKKTLHFPNEYFMIVIIQLSPTFQLFNKYTSLEYENIQSGFYSIVKDMFSNEFPTYILPGDYESLYIIVNVAEQDEVIKVNSIIKEFSNLLQNDSEHVKLSVGRSKLYKGIEGLKKAHIEASNSLAVCPANSSRVLLDAQYSNEFDFGCREESDLFTALLSMNKQKVYELLNIIFDRNKLKPNKAQKRLYTAIMDIAFKVFELKQLGLPENKSTEDIMSEFSLLSLHDMKKFVMNTVDYILDVTEAEEENKAASEGSGQAIINYIEENYTFQGLSIDYLASYFHMSTSGISMTIKNTIGMGFHEYLTNLRVNKAKTLLLTTDDSISDISDKCGFSSQQTFYRSFKKVTGQTTSQVRAARQRGTSENR
ncbi:MAG: helix-turn-helix domain-containing protein [Candidatus Ornithomonoglobus sp.]